MAKAGKWSHLKGKLPAFEQPPEWQEKVNEAKKAFLALGTVELARAFSLVKKKKSGLESDIKTCNCEIEAISQIIRDLFEADGIKKIQTEAGATVYLSSEPYASVKNKAEFLAWVREQEMESMLTMPWQTLNATTKERLLAGQPAPPGIEVYFKTDARLRGADSDE